MEEDMKLNPEYTFSRNSSYICRSITRGRRGLLKTFHYLTWLNHNTESYSTRCKCFPFHLSIINNVYIILLNRKSCIYQYINVDIDTLYIMKFIGVQLAFRKANMVRWIHPSDTIKHPLIYGFTRLIDV